MNETIETAPADEVGGFQNPYGDSSVEGVTLSFRAYKSDWELIKCTRPATATISTCLGFLWKGLANALRRLKITDVTRSDEFERLVVGLQIISHAEWLEYQQLRAGGAGGRGFHDSPPPGANIPKAGAPNVRSRATRSRNVSQTDKRVVPDVQSGGGKD